MFRKGKSIETRQISGCLELNVDRTKTDSREAQRIFWGDGNVLELDYMMFAQLWKFTKNH